MSFKTNLLAASAAVLFALPAFAGSDITVTDAYARSSGMSAKSGAAFMVIANGGDEDDQLIAASSDAAKMVQLHTHIAGDNGVMQMREVPGGFPIPAHGEHALARGGDHVMLMGLNQPMADGDVLTITLVFEKAGEMSIEVPVDLER